MDRRDFAQLTKVYAAPREGEQRYSPAEVVEVVPDVISGNPDPAKICTSHVERQNFTDSLTVVGRADGLQSYIAAVDEMLMDRCDYAQLVKSYTQPQEDERRYSPAECTGAVKVVISGNPDEAKICTSHVERLNLTMRMQMRRLTRLTSTFSRKLENHRAAVALHFAWYNFCQIHGSLRVTPATEAGIADHIWSVKRLLAF